MSQAHVQPQKRKRVKPVVASTTPELSVITGAPPLSSSADLFAVNYPPRGLQTTKDMLQYVAQRQISKKRYSAARSVPNQIARKLEAITTNAWRREWEVAPHTMAPSRPISLLTEPANINLKSHTRKARRAFLSHFDAENEPQGRLTQRLREEERERKIIEQYLEEERDTEMKRRRRLAEEREKVKVAAHTAEVIDLTKDDLADFDPTWEILPVDDADNLPLPQELDFRNPICSFAYPSGQLEKAAVFSPSGAYSAQRRLTSQANLDEPQVHAYPEFLPQELDFGSLFDQDFTTEMLNGYQDYHSPWGQ